MADTPTCTTCGTCCFSQLEKYVRVRGDDHARLGADAETLVVFHGNEAYMRMENGHCAALVVDASEASTAPFTCRVYATRPETCRALERGSPECAGEIATKGERPRRRLALVTSPPASPDSRARR